MAGDMSGCFLLCITNIHICGVSQGPFKRKEGQGGREQFGIFSVTDIS